MSLWKKLGRTVPVWHALRHTAIRNRFKLILVQHFSSKRLTDRLMLEDKSPPFRGRHYSQKCWIWCKTKRIFLPSEQHTLELHRTQKVESGIRRSYGTQSDRWWRQRNMCRSTPFQHTRSKFSWHQYCARSRPCEQLTGNETHQCWYSCRLWKCW